MGSNLTIYNATSSDQGQYHCELFPGLPFLKTVISNYGNLVVKGDAKNI